MQDMVQGEEVSLKGRLIHTLLLLFRQNQLEEDKKLASECLKSLEKGRYKTVIVYNQGCLNDKELKAFLSQFELSFTVIGNGINVGTVIGRQSCFEYIWDKYPDTKFISELHLDMIFTSHWEDPLIDYLENNDEPIISAGIIDKTGCLTFLNSQIEKFSASSDLSDDFLMALRCDKVVHGFTNPCIHVAEILKYTGGYNAKFLKGKQCYEDDSMLLGYYYYYGTKANWYPKVNYNSVVYHAVAGQRLGMGDSVLINYQGLVRQYGAMGLKHLSQLHKSPWHIQHFTQQYNNM